MEFADDLEMILPGEKPGDKGKPVPKGTAVGGMEGADKRLVYAVLILRHLRLNPGRHTTADILAAYNIPATYGPKVITRLAEAGLITATRGKGSGGISLAVARSIAVNDLRKLFGLAVIPWTEI